MNPWTQQGVVSFCDPQQQSSRENLWLHNPHNWRAQKSQHQVGIGAVFCRSTSTMTLHVTHENNGVYEIIQKL